LIVPTRSQAAANNKPEKLVSVIGIAAFFYEPDKTNIKD
jgi:hypothetical protein